MDEQQRSGEGVCAWRVAARALAVLDRPRILAILNITPDSFSDGGEAFDPALAVERAARCVEEGADMLDVGGESTRPGASRVPADEQLRRVLPALRAIRAAGIRVPITIDTTRSDVARAALDEGADAVNDVSGATEDPDMLALCAQRACGVILMHRGAPPPMDRYSHQHAREPVYDHAEGVVGAVRDHLLARARDAEQAGVARAAIVIDPGLGFGKSVRQNLQLVAASAQLCATGYPLLGAASRKSFVGAAMMDATGEIPPPAQRIAGSIAVSVCQLLGGVRLFRVHDVKAQREALNAAWRVMGAGVVR